MDNIFIERLWRWIKYEEVHLKAYADAREARAGIGSWMTFYNFRRPHQAMNNQMPMAVWRAGMDKIEAAASAVDMPLRSGQRKRVAHIPTAQTEAARSCLILEGQGQARSHLKSNVPWSHEWGPVQIDHDEFTLEWFEPPGEPAFKCRPQDIAVLHPEFRLSGK